MNMINVSTRYSEDILISGPRDAALPPACRARDPLALVSQPEISGTSVPPEIYQREFEDLLVEYESLSRTWPEAPHVLDRAKIAERAKPLILLGLHDDG